MDHRLETGHRSVFMINQVFYEDHEIKMAGTIASKKERLLITKENYWNSEEGDKNELYDN